MTTSLTSKLSTWWNPTSTFNPTRGISKIDINIRTAKLEYSASFLVSRKEDMKKYNSITKDIQPFIDTLKSMGYEVNKSDIDYKLDSWEYVTAGIKISITK